MLNYVLENMIVASTAISVMLLPLYKAGAYGCFMCVRSRIDPRSRTRIAYKGHCISNAILRAILRVITQSRSKYPAFGFSPVTRVVGLQLTCTETNLLGSPSDVWNSQSRPLEREATSPSLSSHTTSKRMRQDDVRHTMPRGTLSRPGLPKRPREKSQAGTQSGDCKVSPEAAGNGERTVNTGRRPVNDGDGVAGGSSSPPSGGEQPRQSRSNSGEVGLHPHAIKT